MEYAQYGTWPIVCLQTAGLQKVPTGQSVGRAGGKYQTFHFYLFYLIHLNSLIFKYFNMNIYSETAVRIAVIYKLQVCT